MMNSGKLKVLQLSTSDITGGASVACLRGHESLRKLNVDSTVGVKFARGDIEGVKECRLIPSLKHLWKYQRAKATLNRYRRTQPWGAEHFSSPYSNSRIALKEFASYDLIHFHWITDFIDLRDVVWRFRVPWVWTLHDMNLLTGGCHYSFGCTKYRSTCGKCPQLGSERLKDFSFRNHQFKRRMFNELDENCVRIVTPSQWLANHVSESPIANHLPIEVVPNGIDVGRWRPLNKSELKSKLGLDPEKTALLYVAENFENRRKGFLELMSVFKGLKNQDAYQFVSVGNGAGIPQWLGKHLSLGVVRDEARMIEIYNACDLFIVPSFEDNFPNVILESMACGTPVIAFGSGGIVEMIDHQSNGLLVETGDLSGMRDAIEFLAENSQLRRQMGEAARNRVCNRNSLELHGSRLLRLYEELLENCRES